MAMRPLLSYAGVMDPHKAALAFAAKWHILPLELYCPAQYVTL